MSTLQEVTGSRRPLLPPAPGLASAAEGNRGWTERLGMPPPFVDRCRAAYLSVAFDEAAPRVLGVTSAHHGEGKTAVALGILTAMAFDTAEPSVLVECDLASGSGLDRDFDFDSSPGLLDWVDGISGLRMVRMAPFQNAYAIPAGGAADDPGRAAHQLLRRNLIETLTEEFKNVVIDLPPMLGVAGSEVLAQLASRVLVVTRSGVSRPRELQSVIDAVGRDRLRGIVFNAHDPQMPAWLDRIV
ncbi:MAG: hypothetical protein ACREPA_01690 [Candidatus Dormibacteraceae bacterium]